MRRVDFDWFERHFPHRPSDAHKGTMGTLVSLTGSYGFAGAAILSAKAALRSGVGLHYQVLPESIYPLFGTAVQESVCVPVKGDQGRLSPMDIGSIHPLLDKATAVLIGCGMGCSETTAAVEKTVLDTVTCPVIMDADGINALARHIHSLDGCQGDIILTPHVKEFSRLSGRSVEEILSEPAKHAQEYSLRHHDVVLVLKGHRTYIAPNIDAYVLAQPDMAQKLIKEYGVDKNKIYPLGIPTFDKFTAEFSKEELCKREGLDPNKKTVLLMAGSFGVTGVLRFYEQLAKAVDDLQMIVITGKNKKLFEQMNELVLELNTKKRTKLLYFVDNVEDYMHVSDLIVTKPGGLTVTESLACGLPLAIYSAFPGQELDNAEYLVGKRVAVLLDKKRGAEQIISLINSPGELEKMKENCRSLAMPDSAGKLYQLAQKLI